MVAAEAKGDHVAVVGENRKLLVFPLTQLPEMARGKGVRLQRYKDGGVSDAKAFTLAEGLTWKDSVGPHLDGDPPPTSRTGSPTAPKPGACRRRGFRRTTGSGDRFGEARRGRFPLPRAGEGWGGGPALPSEPPPALTWLLRAC